MTVIIQLTHAGGTWERRPSIALLVSFPNINQGGGGERKGERERGIIITIIQPTYAGTEDGASNQVFSVWFIFFISPSP